MRHSVHLLALAAMATAILGTGCDDARVVIHDDIVQPFHFGPIPPPDGLHQPYVRGSDTRIHVGSRSLLDDVRRWSVSSSDESVLAIVETDHDRRDLDLDVEARGEGLCELTVFDRRGKPIRSVTVEVMLPDRAVVKPHGDMAGDFEELVQDTRSFQVLEGGEATFLVQWYAGTAPLFGTGALEATAEGELDVDAHRSTLFDEREFLTVRPEETGATDVALFADGIEIEEVEIEALDEDEIATVRIHAGEEDAAQPGDTVHLLAHATDDGGRPIYGVGFDWSYDGHHEPGQGDLYQYTYDHREEHDVSARFDGLVDKVEIHGRDGEVDSTSSVGCNAGRGGAKGLPVLALALGWILANRRR